MSMSMSMSISTMKRKAFVLLSGGLDSTTCLHKAIYDFSPMDHNTTWEHLSHVSGHEPSEQDLAAGVDAPTDWVEAVSIDYGQRHIKETEYARRTCARLGIKHTTLDIGSLLRGTNIMLSRDSVGNVAVPDISYADIKGVSPTYVPFRNGLMLSVLAAHTQKYVNEQIDQAVGKCEIDSDRAFTKETATAAAKDLCGIYFGAHADDALNWAYPDCTPEFIGAMANAIYIGSYFTIRLFAPLAALDKAQIVGLGTKLGVALENTWSCYKGEELHCGTCPTCISRREGFVAAGLMDPTTYAAGNNHG